MNVHVLKGCASVPLANYLKALGILRLVGEQADKQARGWWDGEYFCLLTKLTKEELEAFFLDKYEPTPMFNPWGARSGYYAGSSEKTARAALTAIDGSQLERLVNFRSAISIIRSVITDCGGGKPDTEETKRAMLTGIRTRLRGSGLAWLDTVMADLGDSFRGPALLGTGGNERSGSYTAPFLAGIVECLIRRTWDHAIQACLWTTSADLDAWDGDFTPPASETTKKAKKKTVAGPFRQFLPDGKGSPWDLLLCFEGSIVIQSGVSRRSNTDQHRFLTSPFYFAPLGIGAGSSSEMDEYVLNKGRRNPGRGEQWFPLWSTPSTYAEIQRLFRDGRCSVGRRAARNPLDAARAICGLGVASGVSAFLRYGYLQRDNLATHFAVPLGRIQVRNNSAARLVDDLSVWLDRIHRLARKSNAPARLGHAYRRLADAVFAALSHDHTPARWQAILLAAADIESLQATGTAIEAQPIPPLRPDWIEAVDDFSKELRLAVALGSAAAGYSKEGRPFDPTRHHWLPLEGRSSRFATTDKRLLNDPRVVASGRDALRDFAAVVERRLIEAGMKGERRLPMRPARGCGAQLGDLAQFVAGAVDLEKLLGLARAFMAIKWDQWDDKRHAPKKPAPSNDVPDEAWLVLRLANLPSPLDKGRDIPAEPRIVRLLMSGDATRAIEIGVARLQSAGIRPPLQFGVTDSATAQRWAATLAFPIHRSEAQRAAIILDPRLDPKKGRQHA